MKSARANRFCNAALAFLLTSFFVACRGGSSSGGGGGGGNPPPVPTGLTATPGNLQVGLTWTASAGATAKTAGDAQTGTVGTALPVVLYGDFESGIVRGNGDRRERFLHHQRGIADHRLDREWREDIHRIQSYRADERLRRCQSHSDFASDNGSGDGDGARALRLSLIHI